MGAQRNGRLPAGFGPAAAIRSALVALSVLMLAPAGAVAAPGLVQAGAVSVPAPVSVPEPTTWVLLALGLSLGAWTAFRRRRGP